MRNHPELSKRAALLEDLHGYVQCCLGVESRLLQWHLEEVKKISRDDAEILQAVRLLCALLTRI